MPTEKTLDNIRRNGILEEDRHRADSYVLVKNIIDDYHKAFIERVLTAFKFKFDNDGKKDSLEEYFMYYNIKNKEDKDKDSFKTVQINLRKQIADGLVKDEAYRRIDKKELIQQDLISFLDTLPDSDEKKRVVSEFHNFTTYFIGFNKNRKNMYSAKEQSTAISYRLIHENLPKFVDNMRTFAQIMKTDVTEKMPQLYADFESYLHVGEIAEMFQLSYFNTVITQSQIDVYNAVIGKLNEFVNLYKQQHKEIHLPKMKLLFKQILSDRNAVSWLPEEFESSNQVLTAIQKNYEDLCEHVLGGCSLSYLLKSLKDYDLNGVYIRNDLQLTDISQKIFGDWGIIQKAIKARIEAGLIQKKKESFEDYQERINKRFKSFDSFSIQYINDCLLAAGKVSVCIEDFFIELGAINTDGEQKENLFARISNVYEDVKGLLNNPYPEEKNLAQDKDQVAKIKLLLDAMKDLQHFIKPLLGKGDESEKDERFYGEFVTLWNMLDQITPLYNKVRNFVSRKPYSEEKIKLNFKNPAFLNGWSVNQEKANSCMILRDNGLYYLAILDKKYKGDIQNCPLPNSEDDELEKMFYLQAGDPSKEVPNFVVNDGKTVKVNGRIETTGKFAGQNIRLEEMKNRCLPTEINEIRKKESYLTQNDNFKKADLIKFIDYYKQRSIEYYSSYKFSFKKSSEYNNFAEFTNHINAQAYQIQFKKISKSCVFNLVDEGKLYLFQIYNKDFSSYSKGTPNLHTLYWKMLFDERNLANVVYKLNGQAEVFFRKSSITCEHPTHPANQPIKNKNKNNEKQESLFAYDIVKNRRYTVDKFQFHVPITMNFKSAGINNINQHVNEYLQSGDNTHVIGIDRGERHLLYLVVIDNRGDIKEQFSLNEIVNEYRGNTYRTNYHNLLEQREGERQKARSSWQSIENIKELKEGYLSQVIHKITDLMVKYNAIVVLEDLNFGFMRGRQKVEKQVYQKFEKMLINKLNYLVDKKMAVDKPGGLLKAYQLTGKFESFQKLGKQSGFLFYIPAWNTSKIDPVTGFVNLLDTHYEKCVEKSKNFFCKFDAIRYNASNDWFEFVLDYDKFGQRAEGTKTHWTLCTYGTRIETLRNANGQWYSDEINLTEKMKEHLDKYHIGIDTNLKEAISNQTEKGFFEGLLRLLKLTLQMRNSKTGTDIDYLISPVANADGKFYDSRSCGSLLPDNADANGAYNIARKGLWAINQIRSSKDLKKVNLAITNKDWLRFAQEKPYLND